MSNSTTHVSSKNVLLVASTTTFIFLLGAVCNFIKQRRDNHLDKSINELLSSSSSSSSSSSPNCRSQEEGEEDDPVLKLIRPCILTLTPYRCARDDYSVGILLDANENSFGPPLPTEEPTTTTTTHATPLERYPCPYQRPLKSAYATFRHETLTPSHVFLGVGSDEAIDLLIRVTCRPGSEDAIMVTPPTYGMYSVSAHINDVKVISIPLQPNFQLNVPDMLAACTNTTKLIFCCHPGNPTAKLLRLSDLFALLTSPLYQGLVVVDEAYIDFCDEPSSVVEFIHKYDRLVVLQTLSKSFGLAGIRLGVALGCPRLIQVMNNVKAPYNINTLTSTMALQALGHLDLFQANIDALAQEKESVIEHLRTIPAVLRVLPSDTNFVLFQINNAHEIYKTMAASGVVIRYRGNLIHLTDCLRATIGTRRENSAMLALLLKVSEEIQERHGTLSQQD